MLDSARLCSLLVAWDLETSASDARLARQECERPLHRRRPEAAASVVVWVVEEPEEEQCGGDHDRDAAHHGGLQLVLKKADVPTSRLGQSGRMGLSTWMGQPQRDGDADDVVLKPVG